MAEQEILQGFNARNARVGMTGAVRAAKLGTAKATMGTKYDSDTHKNLGYLAPDGLEISFDEDKQEYIPWQEVNPIRVDVTKAVKSIKMTLWESSVANLAKFLGITEEELKTGSDGVAEFYEGNLPDFPHEWLAIDVIDKDKAMRLTLPDAQITARGALNFKKDDMVGLEITYSTYPASEADYKDTWPDVVGNTGHWQFNKAWAEGGRTATSSSMDGAEALKVKPEEFTGWKTTSAVNAKVTATGGTAPYTFSATGLPTGLSIDESTGAITGTPTSAGAKEFTVKVVDSKKLEASEKFNVTIS